MKRGVVIVVAALIVGWALTGLAQNRVDPTAVTEHNPLVLFQITVSKTAQGVTLTCAEGGPCAWKTLGFGFSAKPVAVNDHGMAGGTANAESSGKFLIHVGTKDNAFALTCERGCAWKSLSFPATEGVPVAIDQLGMVKHRK